MKLENVTVAVALNRAWIYWGKGHVNEYDTLSHTLLCGGEVTYPAYDAVGVFIGMTRIIPEQLPVMTVTEIHE